MANAILHFPFNYTNIKIRYIYITLQWRHKASWSLKSPANKEQHQISSSLAPCEGNHRWLDWSVTKPRQSVASYRKFLISFQWRHNERDGVSHYWRHDCLLNRFFRRKSTRICEIRIPWHFVSLHKNANYNACLPFHDDVIKWKHFPRYWPFVRGIHRPPVNSSHKSQCREAVMFYLICAWINGWVNNRESGDFRRHRVHYDVTVMGAMRRESETDYHAANQSHLPHYCHTVNGDGSKLTDQSCVWLGFIHLGLVTEWRMCALVNWVIIDSRTGSSLVLFQASARTNDDLFPFHDDVIKWKHFPRYWPFVWGIHRSPVTRNFDVFFDLSLNKRLGKQPRRRWFETPSRSLLRQCIVSRFQCVKSTTMKTHKLCITNFSWCCKLCGSKWDYVVVFFKRF